MSGLNFLTLIVFIYILTLQSFTIECRPHTQKIIVHGHEWTVPNEPGWEKGTRILNLSSMLILCFFSSTRS
jgi:hypothetical protein